MYACVCTIEWLTYIGIYYVRICIYVRYTYHVPMYVLAVRMYVVQCVHTMIMFVHCCRNHHLHTLAGRYGVHLLLCLIRDVTEGSPTTRSTVVPEKLERPKLPPHPGGQYIPTNQPLSWEKCVCTVLVHMHVYTYVCIIVFLLLIDDIASHESTNKEISHVKCKLKICSYVLLCAISTVHYICIIAGIYLCEVHAHISVHVYLLTLSSS